MGFQFAAATAQMAEYDRLWEKYKSLLAETNANLRAIKTEEPAIDGLARAFWPPDIHETDELHKAACTILNQAVGAAKLAILPEGVDVKINTESLQRRWTHTHEKHAHVRQLAKDFQPSRVFKNVLEEHAETLYESALRQAADSLTRFLSVRRGDPRKLVKGRPQFEIFAWTEPHIVKKGQHELTYHTRQTGPEYIAALRTFLTTQMHKSPSDADEALSDLMRVYGVHQCPEYFALRARYENPTISFTVYKTSIKLTLDAESGAVMGRFLARYSRLFAEPRAH